MTQLVNKASSWRTLRHKVVVGASSIALVAGMGVALAPAAQAADPGSYTVKVTGNPATDAFPAETELGSSSAGLAAIAPVAGANSAAASGNDIRVRVTASGNGIGVANVLTALDVTAGSTTWTADLQGGSATTNSLTALSSAVASFPASEALTVAAAGTWEGDVTFAVAVVEVETATSTVKKVLGSGSFETTLGTAADAVFVDDQNPAVPTAAKRALTAGLDSDFSANLIKTAGFPSPTYAPTNLASGTTWTAPVAPSTVGTLKDTAGNVFSFDTATGKVTAVAAGVTKLSSAANPAIGFDVVDGGNKVTVTLSVGFKDDASIATTLKADVYSAVQDGIIEGYEDGSFKPVANVSRQAFAAFAARYLNANAGKTLATSPDLMCNASNPSKFSDVANNAPFCAVIRDLATTGVTDGYADGTFKPAAPISRQAIAAMLFRIDNLQKGLNVNTAAPTPTTASFTDVAVSAPFAAEIYWAKGKGLVTGWADNTFRPTNATSRQATAVFFTRLKTL